jgi:hypothetical protein
MAAGRLPAPLGVGRVGAAVVGAAEADVEEGAVHGAVERVAASGAAAVGPHPLPIEQVALPLVVALPCRRRRRHVRLSRDGDPAGPERRPGGLRAADGRRAAERGGAEQQQRGGRYGHG